jgi:YD repeat-containing protein
LKNSLELSAPIVTECKITSMKLFPKDAVRRLLYPLSLALAASLFVPIAGNADEKIDKGKEAIRKNKIKSATSWVYGAKSGIIESNGYKGFTKTYDTEGNAIKLVTYNSSDGHEISTDIDTYDSSGRIIESTSSDVMHWYDSTKSYVFNKQGQLVGTTVRKPDGSLKNKYTREYDARGDLTKVVRYDGFGSVEHTTDYKRDSKGNIQKIIERKGDGSLDGKLEYRFNSAGNATEEVGYDSNGQSISKTTYAYAKNDYLLEKTLFHPDGSVWERTTYTYDAKNNLVEELALDAQRQPTRRTKYVYEFFP